MRIGIDVDYTLVDIDKYWLEYLNANYGKSPLPIPTDKKIDYDLSVYYTGGSVQEFFGQNTLYDNVIIPPKRVQAIKDLQNRGHEIYFISFCLPEHLESKKRMLDRYFTNFTFIDEREKYKIDVDVMIDDRNDVLNKFRDTILFRPYTPYTQYEHLKPEVHKIDDLANIVYHLQKIHVY